MIRTLRHIWTRYKEIVSRNCTNEFTARTSLAYWQNRLFAASIIYFIPFSIIALVPGFYMAYITDLTILMAVDILAVVVILSVAFVPGISLFARKLLFNGMLYIVSFILLVYLGAFGPGLIYLLGITIFVILSLDIKYGYIAVGLNILICIVVSLALYFEWTQMEIIYQYGLDSWIAVSSNLILLSIIAVILLPILFKGLESAIIKENKLRTELEYEEVQLKNTVEQLNQKNEELEQFAYTISHDLKEPLRMVRSFMGLLERRYAPELDEKATSYINFAIDGAERMTNSIDELLEYSRVGRLYTHFKEIDTAAVVRNILEVLNSEMENMNRAKVDIGDLPTLKVVPVSFKMLMQNLISNALKYQPKNQQPEISIQAKEEEKHWTFSIADNGIGIEEEYFDDIFGFFKRLHGKEEYAGTGMGLAICKKIVEQHGGKIWVESEVNKGSIFYFTIKK